MKNSKLLYAFVFLSIIFVSCDGLNGGMFYSILEESEILDGNLENNISVGSMFKYVDNSKEYYFIAAGNVYYKTANSKDIPNWIICSPFKSRDEIKDNSLTTFNMINTGDYIYGVFLKNDDDIVLMRTLISSAIIDDATAKAESLEGNNDEINKISFSFSWEDFSLNTLDNTKETVVDISICGDYIFLATKDIDESSAVDLRRYNLYSTKSESFSTDSTLNMIASGLQSFRDLQIDYDAASSTYWIAFGNKVFSTDGASLGSDQTSLISSAADAAIGDNDSIYFKNDGFRGILCAETDSSAAGTEIYVTTKEGFLFKQIAGVWTVIKSNYDEDYGLFFDPLFGLTRIVNVSDTKNIDIIIIGCEKGYYEIQTANESEQSVVSASDDVNTSLTLYNQFLSLDLSEKIIQNFYYDSDNKVVFSLGSLSGLWSNNFGSDYWNAE